MSNKPTSEQSSPETTPSASPTPETQERAICFRSLWISCWLGLVVMALCFLAGHANWAWGFLIGGLLSLFSMVTLMLAVPFLTWSGAPRHMSFLLVITLFMKIPIYCVGLYLATHLAGVSAFACCMGICLTPTAITVKGVGNLLNDMFPAKEPKTTKAAKPQTVKAEVTAKPMRKVHTEFVPEQG